MRFDAKAIQQLADRYQINGRAIKNLFSTALALLGPDETIKADDVQRLYAMNQPRSQSIPTATTSAEQV